MTNFDQDFGRLEGKVDSILAAMKQHSAAHSELESRVRGLENARSKIVGMAVLGAAVVSYAVRILS